MLETLETLETFEALETLETDAPNHVTDHIECTFARGWWEDPAYAIDMESEIDAA